MPTFITDDGANLHYEVEGNELGKPALIFIHGWCCNLQHWDHQVRYFQDSHRCLRMDRRGMGRSISPGSGHTPQRHAADVAALARHEGFKDAVVVAHAGGGPVGVYFCAQYPALARAYVMIDTAIMRGFDLDNPTTRAAQYYAEMGAKLLADDGDAYFRSLYGGYFGPQAAPELVESVVAAAARTPRAMRVEEMKLMAADTATLAAAMQQPTLVIAGPWLAENSPSAADPVKLAALFSRVEFARAIGAGHFLPLEAPEQTNAFMQSFLSRLL